MKINKFNNSKPMDMNIVESFIKEEEEVIEPVIEDKFTLSSIVSDLIKKEWDAVDVINGYLIIAQEVNNVELNTLLDSMLGDHYTNIGQLEGMLQAEIPEVENIEDAKEEILDNVEPEAVEEPEDIEEIEILSDDVPDEVVDLVDFSKKEEE